MVFKWKIVVILFGVVLILTIGGLSEIIKAISAN